MNKDYTQIFNIRGSKGKFCESYQDYLPPLDCYFLDKKEEQPNEVTTIFTGRYSELPEVGRLEKRLKEVETKLYNIDKKGWGGGKKDRYNEYTI